MGRSGFNRDYILKESGKFFNFYYKLFFFILYN